MNQFTETKDYLENLLIREDNALRKEVLNKCLDFLDDNDFKSFDKKDLLNDIINYLQNDLCNTLNGSWLVYHYEIREYFKSHCIDILDILENCEYFDFKNNQNLEMIEYLTWSSFEISCWDIASILENEVENID